MKTHLLPPWPPNVDKVLGTRVNYRGGEKLKVRGERGKKEVLEDSKVKRKKKK